MQKSLIFLSFCFIFSVKAFASERLDSIGVENNDGKQIILHKIEAKESYYSLGRKYKISPKDIINYNNNKSLQIGTTVKIPTGRDFTASATSQKAVKTTDKTDNDLIEYKVGPRETLYAIARRFGTTVEELKQINSLKGNSLSVGQTIKVRQTGTPVATATQNQPVVVPVPVTNSPVPEGETDSGTTEAEKRLKIASNRYGLREMSERGVAVWIADENLDDTKMLALHRTAPVGTIIKVTNPMTERSTFAKVVGKFTENESTKDVIVVVTKATADLLGALDKRFQVSLAYGVPNTVASTENE